MSEKMKPALSGLPLKGILGDINLVQQFRELQRQSPTATNDEIVRELMTRKAEREKMDWDATASQVPEMNTLMDNQMNHSQNFSFANYPKTDAMWENRTQGIWNARNHRREMNRNAEQGLLGPIMRRPGILGDQ